MRRSHRLVAPFARCATVLCLSLGACSSDAPTIAAPVSESTSPWSAFRSTAFLVDVNTVRRTVQVSPPSASWTASSADGVVAPGVRFSLLGADAIEMRISNYAAGAIGAVVPGKILLTFDLSLVNRLHSVELGTPTFPLPPAGVSGVQAFPFELSVITNSGGVSSGGNEVLVTTPSDGAATVSNDWDGEPHSFFNDRGCGATSTDCFRYEPYGVIGAGAASAPRRVGFFVDPTVRELRIKLLVAADLRPPGLARSVSVRY